MNGPSYEFDDLVRSAFPKMVLDRLVEQVDEDSNGMSSVCRHKVLALLAILRRDATVLRENLEEAWAAENPLKVVSAVFMAANRLAPARDVIAMVPDATKALALVHSNKVAVRRVHSALTRGPTSMKRTRLAKPDLVQRQVLLLDRKCFDGPIKVAALRLPKIDGGVDLGHFPAVVMTAPGVDCEQARRTAAKWEQALATEWMKAEQRSDFSLYVASNCVLTAWHPHPMIEYGPQLCALDPCIEPYHHARWIGSTLAHQTLQEEIDSALIIAHAGASNHYLRLMIIIVSLLAIKSAGELSDNVMIAGDLSNYVELLAALNIDGSSIRSYRQGLPARIRTAHVSQVGFQSLTKIWWARKYIASIRGDRRGQLKLYISRSRSGNRPMTNEPEVEAVVAAAGYKVVYFEELPLVEQMSLMEQARIVIAPHGAGLANMLFCSKDVRVLELLSESYFVGGFFRLARALGIRHSAYVGSHDMSADPSMTRGAWRVDIESFRAALDQLEGTA